MHSSQLSVSRQRVDALRAEVRAIEAAAQLESREHLPFGIDEVDRRLAGGGLAIGALHEITGAVPDLTANAAATLFVAGIAARRGGIVLWALARRDLFTPGLVQAGLSPNGLVFAECRRNEDVLAVMEEGLCHGGLAAVVGEVGVAAMASTRRLQLAAEQSGTTALMLKQWRRSAEDPLALPSAAVTRWRIGCASSAPLPVSGVGRPRWLVELARQRQGEPFQWILEGSDAEGRLTLPAESSHRSAAADRGTDRQAA